jgi:transposase, IS5 family
LQRGRGP